MTMTMSVTGAGRSLTFDWKLASESWAEEVAPVVLAAMRQQSPVGAGAGAGALRQSISSRLEPSTGMLWIVLYGTVPYLPYVIDGTAPHVIAARNAKALRWIPNRGHGSPMFATSVNHPGTKPDDFPERAIAPLTTMILQSFTDAVREATTID